MFERNNAQWEVLTSTLHQFSKTVGPKRALNPTIDVYICTEWRSPMSLNLFQNRNVFIQSAISHVIQLRLEKNKKWKYLLINYIIVVCVHRMIMQISLNKYKSYSIRHCSRVFTKSMCVGFPDPLGILRSMSVERMDGIWIHKIHRHIHTIWMLHYINSFILLNMWVGEFGGDNHTNYWGRSEWNL